MQRHTPGPWKIEGSYIVSTAQYLYPPIEGDGGKLLAVIDCTGAMGGDNTHADKCLIAAAPELLEALQDIVCCPAFNGQLFESDPESHKAWTLARVAIAKAERSAP